VVFTAGDLELTGGHLSIE